MWQDFVIEGNELRGSALCDQGFAYCWSGARANVGINGGKYCFGCKIVALLIVISGIHADSEFREGMMRLGALGEQPSALGMGALEKSRTIASFRIMVRSLVLAIP